MFEFLSSLEKLEELVVNYSAAQNLTLIPIHDVLVTVIPHRLPHHVITGIEETLTIKAGVLSGECRRHALAHLLVGTGVSKCLCDKFEMLPGHC
jgi:hypothetical protein